MTSEEIFGILREMIADEFVVNPDTITMETSFETDLGANSVDLVELAMAMEERFDVDEVPEEELVKLKTVGDAVRFLTGRVG